MLLAWAAVSLLLACTEPVLIPDVREGDVSSESERPLTIDCRDCKSCATSRECKRNEECVSRQCIPIVCGDRIVSHPEECDDGNTNELDACIRCKKARCGDGKLSEHEECEVGLGGGQRAWTSATCNRLACERVLYNPCTRELDCPALSHCRLGLCTPSAYGSCPQIPDFEVEEVGGYCYVRCNDDGACPPRLSCARDGRCLNIEDDAARTNLNEAYD